jgi:hypothetical protein
VVVVEVVGGWVVVVEVVVDVDVLVDVVVDVDVDVDVDVVVVVGAQDTQFWEVHVTLQGYTLTEGVDKGTCAKQRVFSPKGLISIPVNPASPQYFTVNDWFWLVLFTKLQHWHKTCVVVVEVVVEVDVDVLVDVVEDVVDVEVDEDDVVVVVVGGWVVVDDVVDVVLVDVVVDRQGSQLLFDVQVFPQLFHVMNSVSAGSSAKHRLMYPRAAMFMGV